MPKVGEEVKDRYLLEQEVGDGRSSVVFSARDRTLDRPVAVKVLRPELSEQNEVRSRFLAEMKVVAGLLHCHLLPIFDWGQHEGGTLFIVEHLVDGPDRDLLTRLQAGPLSPSEALHILAPIGDALDAAHERNVLHLDVKPANILLDQSGSRVHPFLTDFGIARRSDGMETRDGEGFFYGTAAYASPEQRGGRHVDRRADIFSFAVVLYEALTGNLPFGEGARGPSQSPTPMGTVRPELPVVLDPVFVRALSPQPEVRHGSCEEVVTEIRAALARTQERATQYRVPVDSILERDGNSDPGPVDVTRLPYWVFFVLFGLAAVMSVETGILLARL